MNDNNNNNNNVYLVTVQLSNVKCTVTQAS